MALEAVLTQALTIKQHCPPGGMLAIMASVEFFSQHPEIFDGCEMAGINYDEHFVISGTHGVLERIKVTLQNLGVLYMSLPVDYGFHSTLIEPAAQSYLHYLSKLPVKEPMIPMVSCHTGEKITSLNRDHFWQATRKPMRFSATLQWFERHISEGRGVIYIDLGPGGSLANFIKRGLEANSTSIFQSVITPFNQEIARLQDVTQCLFNNTTIG
jgi:acyl transferase domain-containing protein